MSIHTLRLPQHDVTGPRIQVDNRLVGPMLAALRRQGEYQFVVETDHHGETAAWLVKSALRML